VELFRLHAYSVTPQRRDETPGDPEGGAVTLGARLKKVLDDNLSDAEFEKRTTVDFAVDPSTRTNVTRDAIVEYAFGEAPAARAAALLLARRLSGAMDHRSTPCLFISAAFRDGERRMVTLWTFPRDEAFQFRSGRAGPSIEVLTDVFSQRSKLRKAACFQGRKLRNDFLSGRALDFQADHSLREVAEFWINRFLDCRFAIAADAGTRLLARTVRRAYEECEEPEDKETLYTAVMAMRRSPHKRLSLGDFANRYLEGGAREAFLTAIPNEESRVSAFEFQRDVFDGLLQFRVFQLESGVFVSSPLSEVGQSVRVSQGEDKRLSCEGRVVDESMRARHA
jgi:hypothetical protein